MQRQPACPATFCPVIEYLIREGAAWVKDENSRRWPQAMPLDGPVLASFGPYFEPETLARVRVQWVEQISNPPFYAGLQEQDIENLPDFQEMVGITFIDTVLVTRPDASLLFHEIVHVAQYRHLGPDAFMEKYVRGWADHGRDYYSIPLESEAYDLQARFEQGQQFSVDALVRTDR